MGKDTTLVVVAMLRNLFDQSSGLIGECKQLKRFFDARFKKTFKLPIRRDFLVHKSVFLAKHHNGVNQLLIRQHAT